MENETGSQTKTLFSESDLEVLLEKLKNGSELSELEMEDILCYVFFSATDSSLQTRQEIKKAGGLKVKLLTMAGNFFGRQTKFLPYAMQYRKEAASLRYDNYERVLEGLNISSINVCRENLEVLVKQFELANAYSQTYDKLYDEIEDGINDGLASFSGFVGMDSMIKMDSQRDKVLRLSKKYKK